MSKAEIAREMPIALFIAPVLVTRGAAVDQQFAPTEHLFPATFIGLFAAFLTDDIAWRVVDGPTLDRPAPANMWSIASSFLELWMPDRDEC